MADNSRLARALANRSRNTLETQMPPAPTQGPVPDFRPHASPPVTVQAMPPFQIPGFNTMPDYGQPIPQAQPQRPQMAAPPPMPAPQQIGPMPGQDAGLPPMPPSQQIGPAPQAEAPMLPASFVPNMTAAQAYQREFAANPGAFDKGWLARLLG